MLIPSFLIFLTIQSWDSASLHRQPTRIASCVSFIDVVDTTSSRPLWERDRERGFLNLSILIGKCFHPSPPAFFETCWVRHPAYKEKHGLREVELAGCNHDLQLVNLFSVHGEPVEPCIKFFDEPFDKLRVNGFI